MIKVAIFASGTGTNFEAIMKSNKNYEVKILVCDKSKAKVIEKAKKYKIDILIVNYKEFETKQECEKFIVEKLKQLEIEYIVLAGYMRILTSYIVNKFNHKIINIHPSLLPSFKGKDAILQAYNYGVKVSGVTIHFVDEGVDTGKIIAQQAINTENLSLEELEIKIHEIEHQLYPKVLNKILIMEENQ